MLYVLSTRYNVVYIMIMFKVINLHKMLIIITCIIMVYVSRLDSFRDHYWHCLAQFSLLYMYVYESDLKHHFKSCKYLDLCIIYVEY